MCTSSVKIRYRTAPQMRKKKKRFKHEHESTRYQNENEQKYGNRQHRPANRRALLYRTTKTTRLVIHKPTAEEINPL